MIRNFGLGLVGALAWTLAEGASAACTVDPCAAGGSSLFDCDQDGYSDDEECNGLSVPAAAFDFPSCTAAPGPDCLDPTVPDVFLLFEKASPSNFDALGISDEEAFAAVTGATGLPQRLHILDPATTTLLPGQGGRAVTARQSAFLLRESTSSPTGCPMTASLGFTPGGGIAPSLNQGKEGIVYTERIINHVECVYVDGGADPGGADALQDKIEMIQHTTAHELTHNQRLAPEDVSRFGGHHYKTGSNCVMDQAVTYTTRKGVSFATSLDYCGPSQASALAGETEFGKVLCEDPDDVVDRDGFTGSCLPATP
jgi:hypothetical protein